MALQLPPLAAIRAFEAAARHASFTKAAEELGMTQAAVSYQIKVLEERVGVPLFLRRPRQVVLTEAGQRLAPAVTEAFALLSEAYAAVRTGAAGHAGHQHHPDIRLQLAGPASRLVPDRASLDRRAARYVEPYGRLRARGSGRRYSFGRRQMAGPRRAHAVSRRFHADAQSQACRKHRRREGARRPLALPILDPGDPWWGSGSPPPTSRPTN